MFIAALFIIAKTKTGNKPNIHYWWIFFKFHPMEYYHQKGKKRTITTPNIIGESHKHNVKQKQPSTKKLHLYEVQKKAKITYGPMKVTIMITFRGRLRYWLKGSMREPSGALENILYLDLGDGYIMSTNAKIHWGIH